MRFGGIVVAAALLLGACSSDPAPREPDRPTTTSSTSAAVPVPTMPPQATEDSPEGAAAFVKHWVDVFNYAAATGDVQDLRRLSAPTCTGCQSYIKLYEDTYNAGGYFKGGEWQISDIEVERSATQRRVFAHVTAPAGTQLTSAKGSSGVTSPEDVDVIFLVSRGAAKSRMEQLTRSEKS